MASFEPQDDFGPLAPPPRPTTPPVRRGFVLVLLVLCLAAGLVYGIPYVAERTGYAWEAGRAKAASEALAKLDKAGVVNRSSALFRMATTAVSPAVVNIGVARRKHEADVQGLPLGPGNRFDQGIESAGAGSGFIVDASHGYIVTNNHVIQNADQIAVRLSSGSIYPARVVGSDPKTDLAVIQIRAELKVAAEWGDSDKLAVGDWVLAIGSPYMLDHTVTAGIISATGRRNLMIPHLDQESYQDFLQTDAAINPGNSGGPLVDLAGKVVGINTAIFTSEKGGNEGIGLAIPSSMARPVVEAIIKQGRAIRGYLGVMIRGVTPDLARQFKLDSPQGAFVANVQPDSPAARAGLEVGDVIVKLGDKDIPDPSTLRNQTARLEIGARVPVSFYRAGKLQTVQVTIAELPTGPPVERFGFRLYQLPPGRAGNPIGALVIDQVIEGSPAARAGLRPGMKIIGVGRKRVHTRSEFAEAIGKLDPQKKVPFEVQLQSGEIRFFEVGEDEAPGEPR